MNFIQKITDCYSYLELLEIDFATFTTNPLMVSVFAFELSNPNAFANLNTKQVQNRSLKVYCDFHRQVDLLN